MSRPWIDMSVTLAKFSLVDFCGRNKSPKLQPLQGSMYTKGKGEEHREESVRKISFKSESAHRFCPILTFSKIGKPTLGHELAARDTKKAVHCMSGKYGLSDNCF